MIYKINRLINSENPYLRKMGWFLYDRLHQEVFSSDDIEEMLNMFDLDKIDQEIENEYEKGTEEGFKEGYSEGYSNGYFDGEHGRPHEFEKGE